MLGELQPVDVDGDEDIASARVQFSVENPLRGEDSLYVSVPHDMVMALRIYDVAGAQIATLQQGNLGAGQHEIRVEWTQQPGSVTPFRRVLGEA